MSQQTHKENTQIRKLNSKSTNKLIQNSKYQPPLTPKSKEAQATPKNSQEQSSGQKNSNEKTLSRKLRNTKICNDYSTQVLKVLEPFDDAYYANELKKREGKKLTQLQQKNNKKELAQNLSERYSIDFDTKEVTNLTEQQLIKRASNRYNERRRNMAASIIQIYFRKFIEYFKSKRFYKIRDRKARIIQKHWKRYRQKIIVPRVKFQKIENHVITIQKH